MASLFRTKEYQSHADNGDPLNGGVLYFYLTTTTTPKTAYPTEADAIAGTNGFTTRTLDADGRCPTEVWISGRYRVIEKDSAGVTISDDDPIEDSVPASDFQDSSPTYGGPNTGTANALLFSFSPALSAYTAGQVLRGRISADNTGAVTVNCDGLGVKSLVKRDGRAIRAGDLQGPDILEFTYDATTDVLRLLSASAGPNIRTDIASAATVDLTGYKYARITGTTTITAITIPDGESCDVVFGGALTLTNGASLINPGAADITTAAGDTARVLGEASSVARVEDYVRAAATPANTDILRTIASGNINTAGDTTISIPAGAWKKIEVEVIGLTAASDFGAYWRVNGDTGANYNYNNRWTESGSETVTTSAGATGWAFGRGGVVMFEDSPTLNNPINTTLTIFDPAGTANRKHASMSNFYVQQAGGTAGSISAWAARWASTAAITSLSLLLRDSAGTGPTGATVNASGGTYAVRGYK